MYKVYNSFTGETYGRTYSPEEATSLAYCIQDELRDDGMPYWQSVAVMDPDGEEVEL